MRKSSRNSTTILHDEAQKSIGSPCTDASCLAVLSKRTKISVWLSDFYNPIQSDSTPDNNATIRTVSGTILRALFEQDKCVDRLREAINLGEIAYSGQPLIFNYFSYVVSFVKLYNDETPVEAYSRKRLLSSTDVTTNQMLSIDNMHLALTQVFLHISVPTQIPPVLLNLWHVLCQHSPMITQNRHPPHAVLICHFRLSALISNISLVDEMRTSTINLNPKLGIKW